MTRRRTGFTVIEMTFALMIGAILTAIAMNSFKTVQSRFAADGARGVYATLHQRARSKAVEMGKTVLLSVDLAGDSAWLFTPGTGPGTGITDVTQFGTELNVDLRGPYTDFIMCMTPRGYADYDCGSYSMYSYTATTSSTMRLEFWQNSDSSSVLILPMGQLVGM